jgi:Mannosyl-glycoprotein endo-beta-N-acetylglucosaminidase
MPQKTYIFLFLCVFATVFSAFAPPVHITNNEMRVKFIARFYKTAQVEQQKFGIPASISLAQGIIESNAGNSRLARMTNNFFGLKCFLIGCTLTHCGLFEDDSKDDRFRKYTSPWQSWRDHSKFLAERAHYQFLFETQDWRKWADGLDQVGYATDKNYCQKLTKIIMDFKLYAYDLPMPAIAKPPKVAAPALTTTRPTNSQRLAEEKPTKTALTTRTTQRFADEQEAEGVEKDK